MGPITLYFLQASRSIRIAWLLEELGIEYEVKFWHRENNKAPKEYKDSCGSPLGKAPVLRDGDIVVHESGAILEYLCAKYDKQRQIIPSIADSEKFVAVAQYIHGSEGQLMLHALAITYTRWFSPDAVKDSGDLEKTEEGMAINVIRDFDWLDGELAKKKYKGKFLAGDLVTGADIMMQFSARFILERGLGTKGRHWKHIEEWLKACEETATYQKAVKKTGYSLDNGGNKPGSN